MTLTPNSNPIPHSEVEAEAEAPPAWHAWPNHGWGGNPNPTWVPAVVDHPTPWQYPLSRVTPQPAASPVRMRGAELWRE